MRCSNCTNKVCPVIGTMAEELKVEFPEVFYCDEFKGGER